MPDLTPILLPVLKSHRLAGLDTGANTLHPAYADNSLINIPASVCHWLGAAPFGAPAMRAEILNSFPHTFQHVILVVVDGMGLYAVQQALEWANTDADFAVWREIVDAGMLAPITSIVPSTTAAALTTLWTGRPPAEHGIVGYEVWLKEYGVLANMILHAPASYQGDVGSLQKAGFRPETFLPVPTLGPHLIAQGVHPYAFQHHSIAHSGLSSMLFPGVEVLPYRSLSDLWVTMTQFLETKARERNYLYVYWGDLDEHEHRFGPGDARTDLEFAVFSRSLSYFLRERRLAARNDTLLLVTADHGHLFTPRDARYELRNHPTLMDMLVMSPSGEARLPFVYLRPGREADFLAYVEQAWPGEFCAIPSQQAIAAGLFGETGTYARLADRLGDFVLVPQGGAYWWFAPRDNPLAGRHGGMSPTEMLSPLLGMVV